MILEPMCKRYLYVVAHPDDECDGAGATIRKLADHGAKVAVAILVGKAEARRNLSKNLTAEKKKVLALLGVMQSYQADFPNIQMNVLPMVCVRDFIGRCIEDWKPQVLVTHHPSDTNNDHVIVSLATQAAFRASRYGDIDEFSFLEAASATEWSLNSRKRIFRPNMFVEVGKTNIDIKLRALDIYQNVSRPYPHPQCKKSYLALAAYRGMQSGCKYAEAFECIYRKISSK